MVANSTGKDLVNYTVDQPALRIVAFCAAECERQHSGEMSVSQMFNAYAVACGAQAEGYWNLRRQDIEAMAALIEPKENASGTRRVPVTFKDGTVLPWEHVDRALDNLLGAQNWLTPEEFYQEFESIHPFVDGNGRLGAICFNFLRDTLDEPIMPPLYLRSGSHRRVEVVFDEGAQANGQSGT